MRKLLEELFEIDSTQDYLTIFRMADQGGALDQKTVNRILTQVCIELEDLTLVDEAIRTLEVNRDNSIEKQINELKERLDKLEKKKK